VGSRGELEKVNQMTNEEIVYHRRFVGGKRSREVIRYRRGCSHCSGGVITMIRRRSGGILSKQRGNCKKKERVKVRSRNTLTVGRIRTKAGAHEVQLVENMNEKEEGKVRRKPDHNRPFAQGCHRWGTCEKKLRIKPTGSRQKYVNAVQRLSMRITV